MNDSPATTPPLPHHGLPLVLRLALGLGLVGSLLWAGYTWYEIATARSAFHRNTATILDAAELNLSEVTDHLIDTTEVYRDTLVDSILQAGEWQLADAPLSLYPDETAIKQAILARWKSRANMKREAAREVNRLIRASVRDDVRERVAALTRAQRAQAEDLVDAATRRSLLTAAVVALALILAFSVALYLNVVRPVRALTRAARRIAEGALDSRAAITRTDEFGVLAHAFNAMVSSLQHALAEVEALNADLGRRVEEKTEALAQTVAKTREANVQLTRALDDLKATQQRLVQAEKMSAIGTLAGGVAHEFNNLLGGIMGSSEAALEEEDLGPESRRAVEVIRRTAERACLITQNLLRFARPPEDALAPADLASLVRDGLKLAETEARKRRVELVLDTSRFEGSTHVPGELHLVVLNLLVNAIHASPEGRTVTVGLTIAENVVRITVDDEGHGIPADVAEKIFDPFFSTQGSGRRHRAGPLGQLWHREAPPRHAHVHESA